MLNAMLNAMLHQLNHLVGRCSLVSHGLPPWRGGKNAFHQLRQVHCAHPKSGRSRAGAVRKLLDACVGEDLVISGFDGFEVGFGLMMLDIT